MKTTLLKVTLLALIIVFLNFMVAMSAFPFTTYATISYCAYVVVFVLGLFIVILTRKSSNTGPQTHGTMQSPGTRETP